MSLYLFLNRLGWPRTYLGKILLLSFIGVHMPMIGAVLFVLLSDDASLMEQLDILGALLVATLVGTTATMATMWALLAPVRAATAAIDGYLGERRTPRLPSRIRDEAGVLMARIQEGVTRLDAALNAAESRHETLRAAHADKFELLSGMSHELRTPLNHILGFASLMQSEAMGPLGGEAYKGYAGTIGESGQQLLSVLQSVLELSEAEAGGGGAREPVDLAAALEEAVDLEHLHAERRGVRLRLDAPFEAPAFGEPRAVKQLAMSLIQNAVEDSAGGGAVTARLDESLDGAVTLTVADAGRPLTLEDVPPELRDQTPGLVSYVGDGAGGDVSSSPTAVRLSLVCSLARLQGASVALDLRPGGGGKVVSVTFDRAEIGEAPRAAA